MCIYIYTLTLYTLYTLDMYTHMVWIKLPTFLIIRLFHHLCQLMGGTWFRLAFAMASAKKPGIEKTYQVANMEKWQQVEIDVHYLRFNFGFKFGLHILDCHLLSIKDVGLPSMFNQIHKTILEIPPHHHDLPQISSDIPRLILWVQLKPNCSAVVWCDLCNSVAL